MRRIMTIAAALTAALSVSTSASAQQTCRAADITSDGFVGLPDFAALSVCFGQPVDVPLPQGDYVGFVAIPPGPSTAVVGIMGGDQRCRANFGPTAHWCTTLEMSKIPDPLALPELGEGDLGEPGLLVRATPPLAGAGTSIGTGTDWVTGERWHRSCDGLELAPAVAVNRVGSDAFFTACQTSGSPNHPGFACCMEPPAP